MEGYKFDVKMTCLKIGPPIAYGCSQHSSVLQLQMFLKSRSRDNPVFASLLYTKQIVNSVIRTVAESPSIPTYTYLNLRTDWFDCYCIAPWHSTCMYTYMYIACKGNRSFTKR